MKSSVKSNSSTIATRFLTVLLVAAALGIGTTQPASAVDSANPNPRILPADSQPYGKSYSEWVGAFWKWLLEYPLSGNPALEQPNPFDLSARQSGQVWFWAAPDLGERVATLPAGKALFLTLRDVECSSLEPEDSGFHGNTEAEQKECAAFWAGHIVNVFCVIDGVPVENLQNYRFSSPQVSFTAPTPWIFGETGGAGTSVGDGYFLMLAPFSKGQHVVHYGGTFRFTLEADGFDAEFVKDITIQLTVK